MGRIHWSKLASGLQDDQCRQKIPLSDSSKRCPGCLRSQSSSPNEQLPDQFDLYQEYGPGWICLPLPRSTRQDSKSSYFPRTAPWGLVSANHPLSLRGARSEANEESQICQASHAVDLRDCRWCRGLEREMHASLPLCQESATRIGCRREQAGWHDWSSAVVIDYQNRQTCWRIDS